ncbi:hypothetical protein LQ948_16525 [Jiella sp. MQZ9-1]|uniref:LPS-assembly lipoprotein n=1 Tax=Jiella flava TaxID=2816857 RepID=A0A939JTQ9_9HYPH|nr:hypothetical protein [Jiella flava]MBO0664263.1 hypothetical protein [Jiella flava]MCD2472814.1 hypothetical protein [Jiella flava]
MSSSDRALRPALSQRRPARTLLLAAGALMAGAALLLAGCRAGPLYGTYGVATVDFGSTQSRLPYTGRIAITEADTRTDQLVRNELLFRLNRGTPVTNPLYEVKLAVTGKARGTIVQSEGVSRSVIYIETATYQVVRLADRVVVASGTRSVTVPYDQTIQLYQSQRALKNARKEASTELAGSLELAIATALSKSAG